MCTSARRHLLLRSTLTVTATVQGHVRFFFFLFFFFSFFFFFFLFIFFCFVLHFGCTELAMLASLAFDDIKFCHCFGPKKNFWHGATR